MNKSVEFLIIGAGIVGLSIANELIERGHSGVLIIEKEDGIGKHASGRNSGVLHAGIYYTPDSLKARFCVEGNSLLKQFCKENLISINNCGKVIVADTEEKLKSLDELKKRADSNGVESEFITPEELREIEPHAFTLERAIYSPNTSVFNPVDILKALEEKLIKSGKCEISFNTRFISRKKDSVISTNRGEIKYCFLINAAGTFAEKIAHEFKLGSKYKSVPFLGTYLELSKERSWLVNGNVYPVPDIRNPFLGVHFTRGMDGKVTVGPTAIPVFGRESYTLFENLNLEAISFLYRDIVLLLKSAPFRANALTELKKYIGTYIYREAKRLIPALENKDLVKSKKSGIRAQLVDWDKKELVMDYLLEEGNNSIHVLNAVSPAFSSSMSFARFVVEKAVRS